MLQAAASRAGAWLPAGLQWGGACHGALGSTMQRAGLPATQLLSGPQQPQQQQQQWRCISEEQLNASQDHLQELFHRTLDNASRRKPQDGRPAFLTTRREALSLYREVLRYSNLFVWKDQQGRVWRDVIRQSTRKVRSVNVWGGGARGSGHGSSGSFPNASGCHAACFSNGGLPLAVLAPLEHGHGALSRLQAGTIRISRSPPNLGSACTHP